MDFYENLIDRIIKIHHNSLKEILIQIKLLNIFEDSFLLQLISYLKMCKLYEIICDSLPGYKYYILNIGESNFIFHDNNHCSCDHIHQNKINLKNMCIHLLTYKILFYNNDNIKEKVDKDKMMAIINENRFI